MCKLDELRKQKDEIYRIARAHKVDKLYVFGSCARKEETPESDVDFIAKFVRGATLFNHFDLEEELTNFLHRHVDVVSLGALTEDTFSREVRKDMVAL